MSLRNQKGETLITVLAAATIGSIVMLGASRFTNTLFKSTKHTELNADFALLKNVLNEQVDCAATFASAGIDPNDPKFCNTNSSDTGQNGAGIYLRLRRKVSNGSVQFLTGPLIQGSAKLGTYSIRATCSVGEQTLVVRAAMPVGSGFAQDPLTRRLASWDMPKALLFGGAAGSIPICYAGQAALPKRRADLVVGFSLTNTGNDYLDVDLTGSAPTSFGNGAISSWDWTEAFQKNGKVMATASVRFVDVRVGYSNVTATPLVYVSYPSPGKLRVTLGKVGDIEAAGGSNPIKGSIQIQLSATQF